MKLLKSFLLCFLFFGLGNFKAQNKIDLSELHYHFYLNYKRILNDNYLSKKPNLEDKIKENLLNLKVLYDEKLKKDYDYYKTKHEPSEINDGRLIYKKRENTYFLLLYDIPDINAVLFNRGNLLSDKKLSDEEKQKYSEMILEIAKQIPNETYMKISAITDEINKDKIRLIIPYKLEIFQDFLDENARKRIEIINFLLWNLE